MDFKKYTDIYKFATEFFSHVLLNTTAGEKAYNYLIERGFTREILVEYKIGWGHKGDLLLALSNRLGYETIDMYKAGLLRIDSDGEYRDYFYGRIIIPILNKNGDIVAISGRTLPDNTHPAKYLNTSETEHFIKGEHLYNLSNAKKSILENDVAIMLEGYFDSIKATQKGIHNVVSVMGTALTEQQMENLQALTKKVIVCFDGDQAGMKSALKRSEELEKHGFDVRLSILPVDVDPDEYLTKSGEEQFRKEIIQRSEKPITFAKETMKRITNFDLEVDRWNYSKLVLSQLNKADDNVEQSNLINETASELEIDMTLLFNIYRNVPIQ